MRTLYIQTALVLGALILTVLLFIANRKPPVKSGAETAAENMANNPAQSLEHFVNDAVVALNKTERSKWELIRKNLSAQKGLAKKTWLDSAAVFWDVQRKPDVASVYAQQIAELNNTAKDWAFAGQRFFYAVRFAKDPAERPLLYSSAIACFEKSLQIDPKNTDVKIDLAACMVEGTADPMKGITMLREIEKTDSMNFKLQLNFGLFSANSGQWPRAISRFKKVLAIDSTYIEAWLNLADAYENNGEKENAIAALEKFVAKTDDPMARTTIKEYILKMKKP